MSIKVQVYHHFDDVVCERAVKKLDKILAIVRDLQRKEGAMSKELDELQLAVEENTSLDNSIIQLVDGLADQIEALKEDPAKLQALSDALKVSNQAIKDAILANTPAPPPPTP